MSAGYLQSGALDIPEEYNFLNDDNCGCDLRGNADNFMADGGGNTCRNYGRNTSCRQYIYDAEGLF